MECGKQLAKIVDYGLFQNQTTGANSAYIKFNLKGGVLTWWGSLNEGKATEITLRQLAECGYAGQDIKKLNDGIDSNILICDEDISVEVAEKINGVGDAVKFIKSIGAGMAKLEVSKLDAMKVDHLAEAWEKVLAAGKTPKQKKSEKITDVASDLEIAF